MVHWLAAQRRVYIPVHLLHLLIFMAAGCSAAAAAAPAACCHSRQVAGPVGQWGVGVEQRRVCGAGRGRQDAVGGI